MRFAPFAARMTLAACAFIAVTAPVLAQTVVFENGNPDFVSGIVSDPGFPSFVAAGFGFFDPMTFDTVRWYGTYFSNNTPTEPDVFTISLFDTTAGVPNAIAAETILVDSFSRTDTGFDVLGGDIYVYEVLLATPITLGAAEFGISIVNDTTADTNDDWTWATSSQEGTFYFRNVNNTPWANNTDNLAFQLINSAPVVVVPEAGTLALVGAGLAAFGGCAMRRRNVSPVA